VENPDAASIHYYESLFSLANGYTGIRGLREEAVVSSKNHPLALIAEVYDRPPRTQSTAPKAANSTRLAPAPNWLRIRFSDGSGWFSTNGVDVLAESYELDMRRGVLERRVRYRSRSGRITRITVRRIVSQARPHVAAIQYSVCPENYRGQVELRSMLDGAATYPDRVPQTEERARSREGETVGLVVRTLETRIAIAQAARHRLISVGQAVAVRPRPVRARGAIGLAYRFAAERGRAYTLEKVVAIDTSYRQADPLESVRAEAAAAPSFARLEREHAAAWADYWRQADIRIAGDPFVQTMARFFVFQLLQAASLHNARLGLAASIPAKTLSGPGYAGHIFWDTEIYMLPFFSQEFPAIARALLSYRADRVKAARRNAAAARCRGIRFPWESADTGLEDCPKWINNSRWWGGEQQVHVNADVPFGFWRHYLATGDAATLLGPGLEIFVGTARYWASRARPAVRDGRSVYELRKVIGPDEYHQAVHNSVYTNAMARWNLRKACDLLDELKASRPGDYRAAVRRFALKPAEPRLWRKVADGLVIHFDPKTGLYEQFDGFFRRDRRIKQADVLMALYLLPELRTPRILRRNFDFYEPLAVHASSLSPCMHAIAALDAGCEDKAYRYMVQACEVDGTRRGGSTDGGLHAAALGGGWSAIVAGFGGVRVMEDRLRVAPRLPKKWKRLEFSIRYRDLRLRFRIEPRRLAIQADAEGPPVPLIVLGRRCVIRPGDRIERRWRSHKP